jgi:uncharacterized protein YukE
MTINLHLQEQRRIVAEKNALQAEVDALKRLQAETAAELDALLKTSDRMESLWQGEGGRQNKFPRINNKPREKCKMMNK